MQSSGRIPAHPGEILKCEFVPFVGLSQSALAAHLKISLSRLKRILAGTLDISPDTAIRLGQAFDMDPLFWLNLQARHDVGTLMAEQGAELLSISVLPFAQASSCERP